MIYHQNHLLLTSIVFLLVKIPDPLAKYTRFTCSISMSVLFSRVKYPLFHASILIVHEVQSPHVSWLKSAFFKDQSIPISPLDPRGLPHRATPGLRRMRLGQSGTDVLLPKWLIPSGKLTFCELERSTIFNGSINYFYGNSQ